MEASDDALDEDSKKAAEIGSKHGLRALRSCGANHLLEYRAFPLLHDTFSPRKNLVGHQEDLYYRLSANLNRGMKNGVDKTVTARVLLDHFHITSETINVEPSDSNVFDVDSRIPVGLRSMTLPHLMLQRLQDDSKSMPESKEVANLRDLWAMYMTKGIDLKDPDRDSMYSQIENGLHALANEVLKSMDLIVCTLGSCDELGFLKDEITLVAVDEANQAKEAEVIVAIANLPKSVYLLVGDPCSLLPTVKSKMGGRPFRDLTDEQNQESDDKEEDSDQESDEEDDCDPEETEAAHHSMKKASGFNEINEFADILRYSLLARLVDLNYPTVSLTTQFRSVPQISELFRTLGFL